MNFQTILEELDRLYDEKVEAEEEITEEVEEKAEEATLTEAAEEEVEIDDDEEIVIVDDEADEEAIEEVQMVLECAKCGALIIKPFAEIIADEESGLVNMEEACQYCEATEGYKVAGTLIPAPAEEVTENDEVEEPAEEPAEEIIEDEAAEDEIE